MEYFYYIHIVASSIWFTSWVQFPRQKISLSSYIRHKYGQNYWNWKRIDELDTFAYIYGFYIIYLYWYIDTEIIEYIFVYTGLDTPCPTPNTPLSHSHMHTLMHTHKRTPWMKIPARH